MGWSFMLPYLVIGILLLGGLAVVSILLIMATWRLALPEVEEIEVGEFPPEILDRQKNLGAKMEAAGFIFAGMQRERRGPGLEVWQALFRTENGAVWGVVEAMENERPRIVLHTFFANGHAVSTSDGDFADYNVTEEWRLSEDKFKSLKEQAGRHQQMSLGVGEKPLALSSPDEFGGKYLETAGRQFEHLERIGFLEEDSGEGDGFRVDPRRAPVVALRMFLHSRRYKWAREGRTMEAGGRAERVSAREEPDEGKGHRERLDSYRRDKQTGTVLSLLGWTVQGAILFGVIMLLLVVGLASGSIDLTTAGIVVGVLVIHEFGHVAMMRVFAYGDLSVLFLPLLGRLAGNRRIRVPAWQEFVVLLMGPLPGLILGWGLLVLGYFVPSLPEFWQKAGFWAALINNLSFLPVLPYDGGRIVNLVIFDRLPALRVMYLLLSALSAIALMIVISLATGSAALWPFLVLGLVAFLAIPENLRLARMAPWAKRNLSPGLDDTDALVRAFLIVEQTDRGKGWERRGWTDIVDRVVKDGCSKKLGTLGTVAALVLCLAALTTPAWIFLGVSIGEGVRVRAEHRELQQRIDDLAPKVSWGGAVVTKKTREDLEMLRDRYQASLETLYSDDFTFAQDAFDYDARGIFDPSEALEAVRKLRWNEVSTWIAEADTEARQKTARVLVTALMGDAREQVAAGNTAAAMNGFSKAYWAISTCEPKTSLGAWIDWLYLEHSLLQEIEGLMGKRGIPRQYSSWFANTVRGRPRFEGKKMALLLLYDLQGTATPFVPPARGAGGQPADLEEIFADAGFALRHSEADRDIRKQGGAGSGPGYSLAKIMGATRIVQGLPTREEYRAGTAVAEAWENGSGFDTDVLEDGPDAEQREIWKRRVDRIQRLQHYRLLAVAAFEIELSTLQAVQDPAGPGRTLPIQTALVTTPGNKFAVTSKAPDGTRFSWQLSPQFAIRRRTH